MSRTVYLGILFLPLLIAGPVSAEPTPLLIAQSADFGATRPSLGPVPRAPIPNSVQNSTFLQTQPALTPGSTRPTSGSVPAAVSVPSSIAIPRMQVGDPTHSPTHSSVSSQPSGSVTSSGSNTRDTGWVDSPPDEGNPSTVEQTGPGPTRSTNTLRLPRHLERPTSRPDTLEPPPGTVPANRLDSLRPNTDSELPTDGSELPSSLNPATLPENLSSPISTDPRPHSSTGDPIETTSVGRDSLPDGIELPPDIDLPPGLTPADIADLVNDLNVSSGEGRGGGDPLVLPPDLELPTGVDIQDITTIIDSLRPSTVQDPGRSNADSNGSGTSRENAGTTTETTPLQTLPVTIEIPEGITSSEILRVVNEILGTLPEGQTITEIPSTIALPAGLTANDLLQIANSVSQPNATSTVSEPTTTAGDTTDEASSPSTSIPSDINDIQDLPVAIQDALGEIIREASTAAAGPPIATGNLGVPVSPTLSQVDPSGSVTGGIESGPASSSVTLSRPSLGSRGSLASEVGKAAPSLETRATNTQAGAAEALSSTQEGDTPTQSRSGKATAGTRAASLLEQASEQGSSSRQGVQQGGSGASADTTSVYSAPSCTQVSSSVQTGFQNFANLTEQLTEAETIEERRVLERVIYEQGLKLPDLLANDIAAIEQEYQSSLDCEQLVNDVSFFMEQVADYLGALSDLQQEVLW